MVRFFRAPGLSEKSDIRLLDPLQERAQKEAGVLFKTPPPDFSIDSYTLVPTVAEADFVVIPQSIRSLDSNTERYLDTVCADAHKAGKKVIAFITGDYANRVHVERQGVIVFKGFEYRKSRTPNEVVFAPFVEDLGSEVGVSLRTKGKKPVVSFCGYAGFPTVQAEVKHHVENILQDLLGKSEYKRGVYFRRKGMDSLSHDQRVETHFIVRKFFSGNLTTASASPETLRSEFVQSIVESDFVLCPKGDGNYSSRFYETLSLGRIPILIDTDMVLPFESVVDYSRVVVRVPFTDIKHIGEYVVRFYESLSEHEFLARQEEARQVFRGYLRFDAYFNKALPLLAEKGLQSLR